MFDIVRKEVFRWATPDPADDWMMVGHIMVRDSGCVLVDPPLVPGLVESVMKLGKLEAIILTTQNHTRGTRYTSSKTGASVYVPEQDENTIDPKELLALKAIGDFERYKVGRVLGLETFKFMDDYAILTDKKELFVGDNAVGNEKGEIVLAPEWFPGDSKYPPDEKAHAAFKELVKKTGAMTLLSSHGTNVYGKLQEQANKL